MELDDFTKDTIYGSVVVLVVLSIFGGIALIDVALLGYVLFGLLMALMGGILVVCIGMMIGPSIRSLVTRKLSK